MKARHLGAALLALLLPTIVEAEERGVSMSEFLERVTARDVRVLEAEVDAARAKAEWRSRTLFPDPVVSLDREDAGVREETLDASVTVSARRFADRGAAKSAWKAAESERSWHRADAVLAAAEVYLDAARARLRLDALREARASFAEIVDKARARARAGDSSDLDAERLGLELATIDARLADAEVEVAETRRALFVLAGEEIAPTDDLAPHPPPPESEGHGHPLVVGAEHRVDAASRALAAGRLAWLPDVSLHGGTKTVGEEDGWTAGVALALPLFDRGQGDRVRSAAELALARADLARARREALAGVESTRAILAVRIGQAEAFEKTAAKTPELLRRTEAAWRDGARPLADLIDAHRAKVEARIALIDLRHRARTAELDFHRSRGTTP